MAKGQTTPPMTLEPMQKPALQPIRQSLLPTALPRTHKFMVLVVAALLGSLANLIFFPHHHNRNPNADNPYDTKLAAQQQVSMPSVAQPQHPLQPMDVEAAKAAREEEEKEAAARENEGVIMPPKGKTIEPNENEGVIMPPKENAAADYPEDLARIIVPSDWPKVKAALIVASKIGDEPQLVRWANKRNGHSGGVIVSGGSDGTRGCKQYRITSREGDESPRIAHVEFCENGRLE